MDVAAKAIGEFVISVAFSLPITFGVWKGTGVVIDEIYKWRENIQPIIIEGDMTKDKYFARHACALHCVVCSRPFPSEKGEVQTQRTYCYGCGQLRRIGRL